MERFLGACGHGLVAAAADTLSIGILQRKVPGVAVLDVEHRLVSFFVTVHPVFPDKGFERIHHGCIGQENAVAVVTEFHGDAHLSVAEPFGPVTPVGETAIAVCGCVIEGFEAARSIGDRLCQRVGCRRRRPASEERKQRHQEKEFGHGGHQSRFSSCWIASLKPCSVEWRRSISEIDGTSCLQSSSGVRSR